MDEQTAVEQLTTKSVENYQCGCGCGCSSFETRQIAVPVVTSWEDPRSEAKLGDCGCGCSS